jgi:uncharacterized protein YbcV (DUF1398 family)
MSPETKAVMRECTIGSDEGNLSFPQIVAKLITAGIESYHTDLRRAEKTYYMSNGESHIVGAKMIEADPPEEFSAAGVEAAVRSIQSGKIDYAEFCARILAAGCVSYQVFLTGRLVVYAGRNGDSVVEPFPAAV